MARAIELSMQNVRSGLDGPFAAVVVKDGKIIAEGSNRVTSDKVPSAHAEIVAIRAACQELDDFQLAGCEIYTTGEPCPMTYPLELYHPRFDSRASSRAPASCAKSRISFRPLQALCSCKVRMSYLRKVGMSSFIRAKCYASVGVLT